MISQVMNTIRGTDTAVLYVKVSMNQTDNDIHTVHHNKL